MPQTPVHVKGVINLRGKVIPVVDLRLKFGLPGQEYTQRTCIKRECPISRSGLIKRMYRSVLLFAIPTAMAIPAGAWSDFDTAGGTPFPQPGASTCRTLVDWPPAAKLPAWLQLGVQVRGRVESPSGLSMLNSVSDIYYLSPIRLILGIEPVSWLRFFAEAQDTPVSLTLRAGRHELAFGGERLIGPADWGMARTFGARVVGKTPGRLDYTVEAVVQRGSCLKNWRTGFDSVPTRNPKLRASTSSPWWLCRAPCTTQVAVRLFLTEAPPVTT